MKGISLWQPWASAMALNSKRIETRHWSTNVRGTVAIHAAQRLNKGELIFLKCSWGWCGALQSIGAKFGGPPLWDLLPFGAIVAIGELVDCRPSESFTIGELDNPRYPHGDTGQLYGWTERQMGDYSLGRFGWVFDNVRRLKQPIPFKGMQGFFHVPDELFGGVEYA